MNQNISELYKNAIKEELVKQNISLVQKIAAQFKSKCYEDLVQEGCIGLIAAADRYDPFAGASFPTYASYWIRKKMIEYLNRYKGERDDYDMTSVRSSRDTEQDVDKAIAKNVINECIADMPYPRYRIALNYMMGLEGHMQISAEELSEILGVERTTVASWFTRGKTALAKDYRLTHLLGLGE